MNGYSPLLSLHDTLPLAFQPDLAAFLFQMPGEGHAAAIDNENHCCHRHHAWRFSSNREGFTMSLLSFSFFFQFFIAAFTSLAAYAIPERD